MRPAVIWGNTVYELNWVLACLLLSQNSELSSADTNTIDDYFKYRRCNDYEEIVHCCPRNLTMFSTPSHWGAMFSVSSAGIHLVEWTRKNSSWKRALFSSVDHYIKVRNVFSDLNLYSHDELSVDAPLVLMRWILGQTYCNIMIAGQKRWDWSVHMVM